MARIFSLRNHRLIKQNEELVIDVLKQQHDILDRLLSLNLMELTEPAQIETIKMVAVSKQLIALKRPEVTKTIRYIEELSRGRGTSEDVHRTLKECAPDALIVKLC